MGDDVKVTLAFPGDTKFPLIGGQWRREGGKIIATYTMGQLRETKALMDELEPKVEEESGIRLF